MQWINLVLSLAPTVVGLVEKAFPKKSPSNPAPTAIPKKTLALNLIQTALVGALGLDPATFGDAEKALIGSINDAVVTYYNAKGWPTS